MIYRFFGCNKNSLFFFAYSQLILVPFARHQSEREKVYVFYVRASEKKGYLDVSRTHTHIRPLLILCERKKRRGIINFCTNEPRVMAMRSVCVRENIKERLPF